MPCCSPGLGRVSGAVGAAGRFLRGASGSASDREKKVSLLSLACLCSEGQKSTWGQKLVRESAFPPRVPRKKSSPRKTRAILLASPVPSRTQGAMHEPFGVRTGCGCGSPRVASRTRVAQSPLVGHFRDGARQQHRARGICEPTFPADPQRGRGIRYFFWLFFCCPHFFVHTEADALFSPRAHTTNLLRTQEHGVPARRNSSPTAYGKRKVIPVKLHMQLDSHAHSTHCLCNAPSSRALSYGFTCK